MAVKLLICDDSAFFRNRLKSLLSQDPDIQVVGIAEHGAMGVEMARNLKPDVITMDYEMPVMDGISAVRLIMAERPVPILMFSSLTYEGARVTFDALEAGAVDFLPKSFEDLTSNSANLAKLLSVRIKGLARKTGLADGATAAPPVKSGRITGTARPAAQASPEPVPVSTAPKIAPFRPAPPAHERASITERPKPERVPVERGSTERGPLEKNGSLDRSTFERARQAGIVLIGTSTGGPIALQKVVSELKPGFSRPVVLVQHMPSTFTPAFAERLNKLSALSVAQIEDGQVLKNGCVYIAPGGMQTFLERSGSQVIARIIAGDERINYKPCVDITFGSAAKAFDGKVLGIVLTGMGQDGLEGARLLKSRGAVIMTQDEASCVIYGMPQAVDRAGLSDCSLDLLKFPVLLNQMFAS
ncbi:chemotaxis response regulator protein-glutamate methylesterase [Allohahella marinimesophila]|uniref:Protein-glutamate methylesterase/protein-glutamine glutaminase n=1 Tax=Allohahella marinimesophila TaxID=1054972 RepID=A0ABP7NIW8_9GAMM